MRCFSGFIYVRTQQLSGYNSIVSLFRYYKKFCWPYFWAFSFKTLRRHNWGGARSHFQARPLGENILLWMVTSITTWKIHLHSDYRANLHSYGVNTSNTIANLCHMSTPWSRGLAFCRSDVKTDTASFKNVTSGWGLSLASLSQRDICAWPPQV